MGVEEEYMGKKWKKQYIGKLVRLLENSILGSNLNKLKKEKKWQNRLIYERQTHYGERLKKKKVRKRKADDLGLGNEKNCPGFKTAHM